MLSLLLTVVVGVYAVCFFIIFMSWILKPVGNLINRLFQTPEQKAKLAAEIKKQQEFEKLTPEQKNKYFRDQETLFRQLDCEFR